MIAQIRINPNAVNATSAQLLIGSPAVSCNAGMTAATYLVYAATTAYLGSVTIFSGATLNIACLGPPDPTSTSVAVNRLLGDGSGTFQMFSPATLYLGWSLASGSTLVAPPLGYSMTIGASISSIPVRRCLSLPLSCVLS